MEDFEMENISKKKAAYKRTSQEQLECFLEFISQNVEILTHKNEPNNPRKVQELWETLSIKLNSLKGPTRSHSEWKKSLSHWKNQIKSKARKIKAHKFITGGGPPNKNVLNSFEERALEAFGTITIDGDAEIDAIGFDLNDRNSEDLYINYDEPNSSSSTQISATDEFRYSNTSNSTPNFQPISQTRTPITNKKPKTSKGLNEQMYEQIMEITKNRQEKEQEFREQFLESQNKLAFALMQVGEGMKSIAKALEKKH